MWETPPSTTSTVDPESGAVVVTTENGSVLGGVSSPWARDAAGEPVPTRFVVTEGKLTQIVEHDDGYAYQIVADPWSGQNLLHRAWVTGEPRGYVVNAVATTWGRTFNGVVTHGAHVAELKQRLGSQAYRVNYTVEQQFLCHVTGNYFEPDTYNMESWRPGVAWGAQLNPWVRCNP